MIVVFRAGSLRIDGNREALAAAVWRGGPVRPRSLLGCFQEERPRGRREGPSGAAGENGREGFRLRSSARACVGACARMHVCKWVALCSFRLWKKRTNTHQRAHVERANVCVVLRFVEYKGGLFSYLEQARAHKDAAFRNFLESPIKSRLEKKGALVGVDLLVQLVPLLEPRWHKTTSLHHIRASCDV
jgi:hypothetical protein